MVNIIDVNNGCKSIPVPDTLDLSIPGYRTNVIVGAALVKGTSLESKLADYRFHIFDMFHGDAAREISDFQISNLTPVGFDTRTSDLVYDLQGHLNIATNDGNVFPTDENIYRLNKVDFSITDNHAIDKYALNTKWVSVLNSKQEVIGVMAREDVETLSRDNLNDYAISSVELAAVKPLGKLATLFGRNKGFYHLEGSINLIGLDSRKFLNSFRCRVDSEKIKWTIEAARDYDLDVAIAREPSPYGVSEQTPVETETIKRKIGIGNMSMAKSSGLVLGLALASLGFYAAIKAQPSQVELDLASKANKFYEAGNYDDALIAADIAQDELKLNSVRRTFYLLPFTHSPYETFRSNVSKEKTRAIGFVAASCSAVPITPEDKTKSTKKGKEITKAPAVPAETSGVQTAKGKKLETKVATGFTFIRKNSKGFDVYRYRVQTGGAPGAVASKFNAWDDGLNRNSYGMVTRDDVTNDRGEKVSSLQKGKDVYVLAKKKGIKKEPIRGDTIKKDTKTYEGRSYRVVSNNHYFCQGYGYDILNKAALKYLKEHSDAKGDYRLKFGVGRNGTITHVEPFEVRGNIGRFVNELADKLQGESVTVKAGEYVTDHGFGIGGK